MNLKKQNKKNPTHPPKKIQKKQRKINYVHISKGTMS